MAERLQLQVILDAIDQASPALKGIVKNAEEFRGKFGQAEQAVKSLQKQQAAFGKMRDLQTQLGANNAALKSAKTNMAIYEQAMAKGGAAAKGVAKPYKEAQDRVKALTQEHAKLTDKVKLMRQALTDSGVKKLADAEAQVAAKIAETNALLDKRRAGLERLNKLNAQHKAGMMRVAGVTALGYGMAAGARKAAGGMGGSVVNAFREQEDASIALKTGMMRADGSVDPAYEKLKARAQELGGLLSGGTTEGFDMVTTLQRQGVSAQDILGGVGEAAAGLAVQLKMPATEAAGMAAQLQKVTHTANKDFPALADSIQRMHNLGMAPESLQGAYSALAPTLPALGMKGGAAMKAFNPFLVQMQQAGIDGESAGAGFGKIMQAALNPKKMQKANAAAGVRMNFTDRRGNFLGMENAYAQFEQLMPLSAVRRAAALREMGLKNEEAQRVVIEMAKSGLAGYRQAMDKLDQQANLQQKVEEQKKTLSYLWSSVKGAGKDVLSSIGETIEPELKKLAAWVDKVAKRIKEWVQEHRGLVKVLTLAAGAVLVLVGVLGTLFMALGPLMVGRYIFLRLAAGMLGAQTGAWGLLPALKGVAGGIWGMTGASNVFLATPLGAALLLLAAAALVVTENWDGMLGSMDALGQNIDETAQELVDSPERGLARLAAMPLTVLEYTAGMAGMLAKDLAEWEIPFISAAAECVSGLLLGFADKTGELKEGIVNMGAKVAKWFSEKLKIRSPSRVFMEFGGFIGQGAALGIERSRQLVSRSALALAAAAAAPAGMAALPAGAAAGGLAAAPLAPIRAAASPARGADTGAAAGARMAGGSYAITINAQPGMDPQAIARAVSAELDRRERDQRGRVLSQLSDMD